MNTVDLIIEAYTKIADGMKRVDLEADDDVIVKAYQVGKMIRVDIHENCDDAKRVPRRVKIIK